MSGSQSKKKMGKMPEDRDYDYVFGKLPRKDKDGKDTTGDKIGKGGRHRDDGTFSSMAYDLEVVDRDLTQPYLRHHRK